MPKLTLLLGFAMFVIVSCQSDTNDSQDSIDSIVVHIPKEPQRLNPIFVGTSEERIVTEHMFLSLCDYDPISGEMVPVLTTDLPTSDRVVSDNGDVTTTISLEVLPDAVWSNGAPVTGHDVAFTLKMANLPSVSSPAWKNLQKDVTSIEVSAQNPKRFSISFSGNYFLSQDAVLTAEILPSHVYDPDNILAYYAYSSMKTNEDAIKADSSLARLGKMFSSAKYSRDPIIEGAAPYRLDKWQNGQFIVLKKVENWWGDNYPDRTLLQAYPEQIVYQVIADPTVAVAQLKSEQLDVLSLTGSAAQTFMDLKEDPTLSEKFHFLTPELTRIYFLLLNNQDVRLADVRVRKALAHLMDVQRLIDQQEMGLGTAVNSPIHPKQIGYNKSLRMVDYSVDEAIDLLEESGWMDIDNDGVREKAINNITEELNLRIFISGSNLSTAISTLLKESAAQAGINIELVTKSGRASRQENIIPGDYEITAQAITSEGRMDPYSRFHTDAMGSAGLNWAGYSNGDVDKLIEIIRFTNDENERMESYLELQSIIERDQPLIFLYAPMEKMAVSKEFSPVMSSKRPGFFVNAFKPALGS